MKLDRQEKWDGKADKETGDSQECLDHQVHWVNQDPVVSWDPKVILVSKVILGGKVHLVRLALKVNQAKILLALQAGRARWDHQEWLELQAHEDHLVSAPIALIMHLLLCITKINRAKGPHSRDNFRH